MRALRVVLLGLLAAFVVAQFIQPDRTNPPVDPKASFESVVHPPPAVAATLTRACGNCHSNQTAWPWYSKVSPVSWIIADHIEEGRGHLNLSRWDIYGPEISVKRMNAICSEMRDGEMPPGYYTPFHPEAKVTAEEIAAVCAASPK
jgi:hypothetical protein